MRLKITKSSDSSLGSAMLAGVAVGVFESPSVAVQKCVKQSRIVEPCPENTAKYNELYKKYKAIASALQPIYDEFG
jgi:ribulose kinase